MMVTAVRAEGRIIERVEDIGRREGKRVNDDDDDVQTYKLSVKCSRK